jgi:PAS domain S-box-containing protein
LSKLRREKNLPEPVAPVEEPLLAEAFESAPHGLALLTARGRVLRANRSLCQMLGFSRGELQALSCAYLIHADDYPTEDSQRQRLAAADIGRYELVLRCLRKNGAPIWVRLAVSSTLRKTNGEAHLVAAVEPTTSPVAKARRTSEDQWLRQFGDAALAAIHEIGNTLTPLMLNAEMILEQATRKELRDSAQQVFKSARRIAFALRRMRGVDDCPKVAYVGDDRMLDLRLIEPPRAESSGQD